MTKKSTDGVIPEGLSLNRILPTRAGEQLLLGWSSDGQWLVAVFGDSSLELWHTQTGILQREYKAPLSRYCWRIQKVGKDTTKTRHFPLSVGNIDHLSCLGKLEHPYESRIRQQYLVNCHLHSMVSQC